MSEPIEECRTRGCHTILPLKECTNPSTGDTFPLCHRHARLHEDGHTLTLDDKSGRGHDVA